MTAGQTLLTRVRRMDPPGAEAIRRRPRLARWILAGPVALLAAVATLMAMPLWVPPGAAGVNELAFPIILTPLLWAIPFFYAVIEENLVRAAVVLGAVTLVQAAAIGVALAGG